MATLVDVVCAESCSVVYLNGVAGIGKSALVRAFAEQLTASGVSVAYLDCRTIEPTERGLLAAFGSSEARAVGAGDRPTVLMLDH